MPVFGTGETDGVHFYAMQFIRGYTLDAVAAEVRRLRQAVKPRVPLPATVAVTVGAAAGDGIGMPTADPLAGPSTLAQLDTAGGPASLSGQTEGEYFRSVARIGACVADALDFAHRQGVLHRDVKPSNLILDSAGTVWVADFGLAKSDDAADLTGTGDIVGTLRFMAPERFRGVSDRRADVYGLGVTLYELLTLRPSFEESDKLRLIDRVREESPVRPRQVNRAIPLDLETIVLKAMAKVPAHRYQTAAALAEDLNRFLSGRPIQARPVGLAEQAWRWARRNPVVAGLLAGVIVTLTAGLTASLVLWRQAEASLQTATSQRQRADGAVVVAQDAIDGLLAEVGDEKLKNIREMDTVRQDLLHQATAFYEKLLVRSGDDPAVRRRAGQAYFKAGYISTHLSRVADAEAALDRAEEIQSVLAAQFPDDPDYQEDLAKTHLERGTLRYRTDKSGEEQYVRARHMFESLIARDPGEVRYQHSLVGVLNNLAVVYDESGRFGPAESAFLEAARLRKAILAGRPGDLANRRQLAVIWHNLARLYKTTGRIPQADSGFRTAVGHQEQVVGRSPTAEERSLLAHILANQGMHLYWSGRAGDARPVLARAVEYAAPVVADHPAVPSYRYTLAIASRGTARPSRRPARARTRKPPTDGRSIS